MKELNLFTLSLKNLKRKGFRTGILIFSIALTVSILVFGLSFILSVNSSIKRASDRLGADLIVVPVGARDYAEEVLLETKVKSFYMDKGIVDRVKKIEGIETVTYQTYLSTIQGACCDIPEAMVIVFNQDTDFIVKPWLKKAISRKLEKGEVIVGHESLLNIGLGLMDIDANIFGIRFKIIGALEKTGTGLDNALFMSDENIEDILKKGTSNLKPMDISVIFTKVRKGYDPYQVGRNIEGEIIEVDVVSRSDIGKDIIHTLKDIKQIFSMAIVLALLLSAFLSWAIFSAIANERSREVGIMRAIGAKESHIITLFFTEVFIIGTIGSLAGIGVGIYLFIFLSKGFSIIKNISTNITLTGEIAIALVAFIVGTIICILGAISPIYRLKKIEPLIAIKEG
ncbi:MAG: ABC transporter permease [Nitrospirae bacterium]|nr:ABC transporter permease [Nitrospirota bacterium]